MIDDCWNRIGVHGDGSCEELTTHIHCRNCPVHALAASEVLKRATAGEYLVQWARHFSEPKPVEKRHTQSAVIFRIGAEWLALSTAVVKEIAEPRPVHSLPHRNGRIVLGLASVRGELLTCASLEALLGLEPAADQNIDGPPAPRRLMVVRRNDVRAACLVDEVCEVHRFDVDDLKDVPATLAKATSRYSTKVLSWRNRSVGLLDDQLLFQTLKRGLA